jgi:hypothetical protein
MSLIMNESNAHCVYYYSLKWVDVHGNVFYNSRKWWRAILPIPKSPCCERFGQTQCQLSQKNAHMRFCQHSERTAITALQTILDLILEYLWKCELAYATPYLNSILVLKHTRIYYDTNIL